MDPGPARRLGVARAGERPCCGGEPGVARPWHTHEDQEESFLLLRGRLTIQLRTGDVHLQPGELFIIPRGAERCPLAEDEAHFLLVGPDVTSNEARH